MQRESKRGSIKVFLLAVIIFVAIIIIISLVFFLTSPKDNPIRKVAENLKLISSNSNNPDNDIMHDKNEVSLDEGSGGGGGGGGSSGESGSEPDCVINKAYHSITNINKVYNCNAYDGEICIDKTITCSAEIHNDDLVLGGNFVVILYIVENKKDQSQALKSATFNFDLAPSEYSIMQDYARVQSTGVDGTANNDINCFFNTLDTPKESTC